MGVNEAGVKEVEIEGVRIEGEDTSGGRSPPDKHPLNAYTKREIDSMKKINREEVNMNGADRYKTAWNEIDQNKILGNETDRNGIGWNETDRDEADKSESDRGESDTDRSGQNETDWNGTVRSKREGSKIHYGGHHETRKGILLSQGIISQGILGTGIIGLGIISIVSLAISCWTLTHQNHNQSPVWGTIDVGELIAYQSSVLAQSYPRGEIPKKKLQQLADALRDTIESFGHQHQILLVSKGAVWSKEVPDWTEELLDYLITHGNGEGGATEGEQGNEKKDKEGREKRNTEGQGAGKVSGKSDGWKGEQKHPGTIDAKNARWNESKTELKREGKTEK